MYRKNPLNCSSPDYWTQSKIDVAGAAIDKALSYDQEWQYALELKDLIENPESGNVTPSPSGEETNVTEEVGEETPESSS